MQDLSLFWQLTLKTIEDLKLVSSEEIALQMFLMQLMHLRNFETNSEEKVFIEDRPKSTQIENEKIDEKNLKPVNFSKNQMKNIEQIKTLEKKETHEENKLQVKSFSELINLSEKRKEMELKYDLERNVKLINFEDGKIDINFNENLNKNFIKKLSNCLHLWTGKRWIITLSKEKNLKTFHEKKVEKKTNIINEEKNSEIFREFSKVFSDIDLIEVRKEDE